MKKRSSSSKAGSVIAAIAKWDGSPASIASKPADAAAKAQADKAQADHDALMATMRQVSGIQGMSPAERRIWCD